MILQDSIPYDVTAGRPLPGVAPLSEAQWLHIDEAYGAQMAERRRLLSLHPEDVHALGAEALAAGQELLYIVLAVLAGRDDFTVMSDQVRGPDGVVTEIDRDAPLVTLGRIVQEDFCLLQKGEGDEEHILTGAVLCFPASWRLSEKVGRPLTQVHTPVPEYAPVAARVQRLFDGVQVGRPLWRFNVLWYDDPTLHQPRSTTAPRPLSDPGEAPYLRSERQSIVRLPETKAVVFSIHTYVVARSAMAEHAPSRT